MTTLENKLFPEISGSWYAPSKELEKYKSVARVELCNTMSSAGDWDGVFAQKIGKNKYIVIPFSQMNLGFCRGFELTTGRRIASYSSDTAPTGEQLRDIYERWGEDYNFNY